MEQHGKSKGLDEKVSLFLTKKAACFIEAVILVAIFSSYLTVRIKFTRDTSGYFTTRKVPY